MPFAIGALPFMGWSIRKHQGSSSRTPMGY